MEIRKFIYDVIISFSGEDRKIAEAIASKLSSNGIRVFYDCYEEATLWGMDLYKHLSNVYQKQACSCIILISKSYAERVWTTHERESAQARALNETREYILPVRLDNTELPKLLQTVGYISLESKSVDDIVQLFLRKMELERENNILRLSDFNAKYKPSKNVIRFYDIRGTDGRPVGDLNVGVSTELVLSAEWSGDYVELWLGSTSKDSQSSSMYYTFFENYKYENDFSKKTELEEMSVATWIYELDVVLIGETEIDNKITELIREHNNEILRIRKENMMKRKK